MANELYISSSATVAPYAIVRRKSDMKVASIEAEAFVTFTNADIDDYDTALTSQGGDAWSTNFPSWIGAGEYLIQYYDRASGTVAITDTKIKEADIYWNGATASDSEVPTAAEMVTLITQALRDNPVGIVTISVDGKTTSFERAQALAELKYWRQQAATEAGTRPRSFSIRMDGGYSN